MADYLQDNKLIRDSQHGFRKGKSCLINLLELSEEVSHTLDTCCPVDIIYLDFQKAFDKVPHVRLAVKLQNHYTGGEIIKWIKEWLKDRKQKVVINGETSTWAKVESGVPQGSVLGTLQFNIYINDINEGIINILKKFADDTKLIGRAGSVEQIASIKKDILTLEK